MRLSRHTTKIFGVFVAAFFVIAATLLTACAADIEEKNPVSKNRLSAAKHSSTVFAMDTVMELSVYGDESLLKGAEALIKSLEGRLSVTAPESEIYSVNALKSGAVSSDTAELLRFALDMCKRTDGALDVTVYPVVRAWGFTTQEYKVPDVSELTELLKNVDYTKVSIDAENTVTVPDSVMLDLGSVAKGYTGDRVMSYFKENGVTSALINLGGNVQALGAKPDGSAWNVAIADPSGDGNYAGKVSIVNKCVITSGAYERCFKQDGKTYHHIIDTSTGYPADSGLVSVSVIGESGAVCDALSTSLFVMGLEKATKLYRESTDFEAVFITDNGEIYVTQGIAGEFTPLGRYEKAKLTVISHE